MDLPNLPCRLRSDVRILRTGPLDFRIVDNRSNANFKLDGADRYLLSLLSERSSVNDIIDAYQSKFRTSLRANSVHEFIGQLADLGLLEDGENTAHPTQAPEPTRSLSLASSKATPPNNDRVNQFFDVLTLLFGWMLHPIWLFLVVPTF